MEIERRYLVANEVRLVSEEGKPKKLVGYPSVFNRMSEDLGGFYEIVAPGTFTETVQVDDIRALFNHESGQVLGRNKAGTLRLREDSEGLLAEIDLPDTTAGRDTAISVERGDITGMSFGFSTLSDEWKREDGKRIRTLKKVRLFDVSPVTFPAYPDTKVAVRSMNHWEESQKPENPNETLRMRLALAEAE
jgi:HK97 family phage prohead protease